MPELWTKCMLRFFGFGVPYYPLWGGYRRLIALATQSHTAQQILLTTGLPSEPPALEPARPPSRPTILLAE